MQSSEKNNVEMDNKSVEIVKFIRENLLDSEGILFAGYDDDGAVVGNRIIDDFGDVAPFIYLYGGDDICSRHLKFIKDNPEEVEFNRAFAYTDLILGLVWYSEISSSLDAKELALELAGRVINKWIVRDRFNSIEKFGYVLPISNGIDSTYIEVWTELFRLTGDSKYQKLAVKTFEHWKEKQDASKIGLIPIHSLNIGGLAGKVFDRVFFSSYRVMKDNTNYGFGLLDLYRLEQSSEVKKSFINLHSRLSSYAVRDVLSNVVEENSEMKPELHPAFAFIDLSCDAFKIFGEERYLLPAIKLADSWMERQSFKTGMFPTSKGDHLTYFDSETDMGVALLKLYECTGDSKYLLSSSRLMEGIIMYHLNQEFPLQVDIESGGVVTKNMKTKFVALSIKLLHLSKFAGKIYQDQTLLTLAKDR